MTLINNQTELDELSNLLQHTEIFALDTEFVRTKTFYPLICLIQISLGDTNFIVDLQANLDFTSLKNILNDQDKIKIIHSPEQDIQAINKFFNIRISNIFDTQLAACLCGYGESISYGSLVKKICDIQLSKNHQFSDWSARPLSNNHLNYAINDVKYLHKIYYELKEFLELNGKLEWFWEDSAKFYKLDEDYLWLKLKKSSTSLPEFVIIKSVLKYRQIFAKNNNIAPNLLIKNDDIAKITTKGNLLNLKIEQLSEYFNNEDFLNYFINNFDYNIELNFKTIKDFRNTKNYFKRSKLANLVKEIIGHFARKYEVPEYYLVNKEEIFAFVCDLPINIRFCDGFRYKLFGQILLKL